jgi:hypothetical protein
MDEVAVGSVQLDGVKPGLPGPEDTAGKGLDEPPDVAGCHLPG